MKLSVVAGSILYMFGLCCLLVAEKGTTLDKINCVNEERLCTNQSCKLTRISRFVTNITVGCTLTKPIKKVMVRAINYERTNQNKYRKNLFDQSFDFCEFVNGATNPLLKTFLPNLRYILGDLFRPCPLSGEIVVKNLTIDGKSSLIYGNPLGYRSTITIMNEQLTKVFTLTMFGDIVNED